MNPGLEEPGKKKTPWAKFFCCALLLCFCGFCTLVNLVNLPNKSRQDQVKRTQAEKILAALEAHQNAEGNYPGGLAEISSETSWSLNFQYRPAEDAESFLLSYPSAPIGALPSDAEFVYDSETQRWEERLIQ